MALPVAASSSRRETATAEAALVTVVGAENRSLKGEKRRKRRQLAGSVEALGEQRLGKTKKKKKKQKRKAPATGDDAAYPACDQKTSSSGTPSLSKKKKRKLLATGASREQAGGAPKRKHAKLGSGSTPHEKEADTTADSSASAVSGANRAASAVTSPFRADPADHCETPLVAYRDLQPLLRRLAEHLGKEEARLRIYDPYFCTGRVKEHLGNLGFPRVRNKCEDFYAAADSGATPAFDVLVTNPPYTATAAASLKGSLFAGTTDHVERLLRYCAACCKPCALLVPNYVYMKGYFSVSTRSHHVAFVAPTHRYTYEAPRAEALAVHSACSVLDARGTGRNKKTRKTAPFVSFWYLLAPKAAGMIWWQKPLSGSWGSSSSADKESADVDHRIHSRRDLPSNLRDAADPDRRRQPWWERKGPKVGRDGRKLCQQCGQVHGLCKHTRSDG